MGGKPDPVWRHEFCKRLSGWEGITGSKFPRNTTALERR